MLPSRPGAKLVPARAGRLRRRRDTFALGMLMQIERLSAEDASADLAAAVNRLLPQLSPCASASSGATQTRTASGYDDVRWRLDRGQMHAAGKRFLLYRRDVLRPIVHERLDRIGPRPRASGCGILRLLRK